MKLNNIDKLKNDHPIYIKQLKCTKKIFISILQLYIKAYIIYRITFENVI
jgi:hypothetical protein